MEKKKMTYVAAMLDYFGKKQGQSSIEFMNELRALEDVDKAWFRAHLPTVGYEIVNA